MKIKLPVCTSKIEDGKLITEESEIEVELITSLACQMRFEATFPQLAQHEDLYSYTERIYNLGGVSVGKTLSLLKTLYCWIDIDVPFLKFVDMFNFTNQDYLKRLTQKLRETFEIILDGSAEKN